jgi:thiopeptide-type bacteriocin biosynthesis protein
MQTIQTAHTEHFEWLQADCSLFTTAGLEPHFPWAPLFETIQEWRSAQLIDRFWFVRKPPGLRLRFREPQRRGAFQATLASWLLAAERRNDIRGFKFTIYEPESYRFGGTAGMDVAHTLFDAASNLVLRFHNDQPDAVSALQISIATSSDLLSRCLDDWAEIWDVWCKLAAVIPVATVGKEFEGKELTGYLAGLSKLSEVLGASWDNQCADIAKAHCKVASDIRALAQTGALSVGLRTWLVAAVTFDWNRLGLPMRLDELKYAVNLVREFLAPDGAAAIQR